MDRLRPALLIAALVVDVGRRLPRRCGSAVPPSGRLLRAWVLPLNFTIYQEESEDIDDHGRFKLF